MVLKESHFREAFSLIILSTVIFIGLKELFPKELFANKLHAKQSTKGVVVDSLLLEAIENSQSSKLDTMSRETAESINASIDQSFSDDLVQTADSLPFQAIQSGMQDSNYAMNNLAPFFEQLHNLERSKNGNVRIAYFGDSQTDGDILVSDIRTLFQDKFGGKGVGFVPITSESASSRTTIIHQFSPLWKSNSFLKSKDSSKPYGIAGNFSTTDAGDSTTSVWLRFKGGLQKSNATLDNPTLFYGNSTNLSGKIRINSEVDTIVKELSPTSLVNTLELTKNSSKKIELNFTNVDSIPFYGCNFDDGLGVHIDNFSTRGNSGLPLGILNTEIMRVFQEKLSYDLLILQYGTNVLGYGTNEYGWYKKRMSRVIEHLHNCFPGVAILVISTADKSSKYGTEMKTDSAVVPLVTAQRDFAIATGCGFISLYNLMGGDSSMVKWVNENPSKANKDYTHFNKRGAKEIAKMLFDEIDKGYNEYMTKNNRSFSSIFNSAHDQK